MDAVQFRGFLGYLKAVWRLFLFLLVPQTALTLICGLDVSCRLCFCVLVGKQASPNLSLLKRCIAPHRPSPTAGRNKSKKARNESKQMVRFIGVSDPALPEWLVRARLGRSIHCLWVPFLGIFLAGRSLRGSSLCPSKNLNYRNWRNVEKACNVDKHPEHVRGEAPASPELPPNVL